MAYAGNAHAGGLPPPAGKPALPRVWPADNPPQSPQRRWPISLAGNLAHVAGPSGHDLLSDALILRLDQQQDSRRVCLS